MHPEARSALVELRCWRLRAGLDCREPVPLVGTPRQLRHSAQAVVSGGLVQHGFAASEVGCIAKAAKPSTFQVTFQDQATLHGIKGDQAVAEDNAQIPDTMAKSTNPQGFARSGG